MKSTDDACAERPIYRGPNCRTVAEIQGEVIALGGRNAVSRFFHSKADKDAITAWREELKRILQIFNVSDQF